MSTLGMEWNMKDDTLGVSRSLIKLGDNSRIGSSTDDWCGFGSAKLTKRTMLSDTNAVFDPLGLFSPVTVVPKIILQNCWQLNTKWDEPVPDDISKDFLRWCKQIPQLVDLQVPRWMASNGLEMSEKISLHVFCDASKDAYVTCIYLRSHVKEEVKIQLVMSNARVAPKKRLTIPHLELLACLIGARLAQQVIREVGMSEEKVWYWTDSSTALTWIQSDKPWGTFVSNRVK
ncbi:hypothetical protein ILUMI_18086 [Ignelater luminosus]|uniref:Uncharacterized protein n=1 Tax=Ignelater luminosus TaxID=2038154 RepID=A0A8K0G791_IGNLU|nr:hypothetical protein ILUMI_18086 [Ignelater luminosus]